MGDDLDDLLDEIEGELVEAPRKPRCGGGSNNNCGGAGCFEDQELDLAIRDICTDDQTTSVQYDLDKDRHRERVAITSLHNGQTNAKCYPVLLGGSRVTMGHSTHTSQRACDRLCCTSCDFHVVYFDDYSWHSRSDYLFFRNNVPDFERLKKNLVKKKGYRAYACQCQWESVQGVTEVSSLVKLKWVCGKHT